MNIWLLMFLLNEGGYELYTKLKYQSFKEKKVYAMKLEAPADKMIMLLQTGAFTFWGHQVMDFVHKIDIQGVLQSFVLVLMRGKCSESKCAVSA